MITYELRDIHPSVNDQNQVIGIAFALHANDDAGDSAEATWSTQYDPALAALDTFSEADIAALCEVVVTDNAVHAQLDRVIALRKTVTVSGNPNAPIITPPPAPTEAEQRALLVSSVDDMIAQTYDRFQRFTMEYVQREAAAQAYKDAGYTGDPTIWITNVAANLGLTNQQTADLVLSQAATLRDALVLLGKIRMDKYLITSAATFDDARAVYFGIVDQRNAIDAGLT